VTLLFLGEVTAQLEQFLEEFLDVPAAGVVALNQLLKLLGEVGASLVETDQALEHGPDGGFENF
jgi:hypothetical protein